MSWYGCMHSFWCVFLRHRRPHICSWRLSRSGNSSLRQYRGQWNGSTHWKGMWECARVAGGGGGGGALENNRGIWGYAGWLEFGGRLWERTSARIVCASVFRSITSLGYSCAHNTRKPGRRFQSPHFLCRCIEWILFGLRVFHFPPHSI